jgi:hypothetical protein
MGELPGFDDVSQISNLYKQTINHFSGNSQARQGLRATAHNLIATLFYAEVLQTEKLSQMSTKVTGQILCRLEHRYQVNLVKELLLKNCAFKVNEAEQRITADVVDPLRNGNLFRKGFQVILPDKSANLSITLLFPPSAERTEDVTRCAHHISKSPSFGIADNG